MVNIQGEISGTIKAHPVFWCSFLTEGMSEVHMASDVVDLFDHFPYVFSPSGKRNPSQEGASYLLRTYQEGKYTEWEELQVILLIMGWTQTAKRSLGKQPT